MTKKKATMAMKNEDDSHGSKNDDDTDRSDDDGSRTNEECNITDNKEQKENKF